MQEQIPNDSSIVMKSILEELSFMRNKMSIGESDWKIIQLNMEDFKESQMEMKKDLSDLKKKLLDPDNGVIIKVNENTKFRIEQQRLQEKEDAEFKEMILEHSELMKWKGGVTKALWIFFTALAGIVVKLFLSSQN
jgi:hypothetical protein